MGYSVVATSKVQVAIGTPYCNGLFMQHGSYRTRKRPDQSVHSLLSHSGDRKEEYKYKHDVRPHFLCRKINKPSRHNSFVLRKICTVPTILISHSTSATEVHNRPANCNVSCPQSPRLLSIMYRGLLVSLVVVFALPFQITALPATAHSDLGTGTPTVLPDLQTRQTCNNGRPAPSGAGPEDLANPDCGDSGTSGP